MMCAAKAGETAMVSTPPEEGKKKTKGARGSGSEIPTKRWASNPTSILWTRAKAKKSLRGELRKAGRKSKLEGVILGKRARCTGVVC